MCFYIGEKKKVSKIMFKYKQITLMNFIFLCDAFVQFLISILYIKIDFGIKV